MPSTPSRKRGFGPSTRTVQKLSYRQIAVVSSLLVVFVFVTVFIFNMADSEEARASSGETMSTGSFIINVGITPQTVANGLKPYGLVYELVTKHNVPVRWVIEPTKVRDGIDFTYNSVNYKGGPFIVPAEYIDVNVSACIASWQLLGVQGTYTASSITVPVQDTITSYPNILIDNLSSNDTLVIKYFQNAGIPSSAYSIGTPANLTACHDLWANPHGDPDWSSHNYLYNFVTEQNSYIWSQCHAVSMLEGARNTASPFEQLNYLTLDGLQCWKTSGAGAAYCGPTITQTHVKNATSPYTYYYPTDRVMQFMGNMSNPTTSGSEQWFRPQTTGGWRTTTRRLVTTATGTSPNEGVLLVYGPAYGDSNNGWVMYIGGHDLNIGTASETVSAQRSFFNFMLLAGKAKAILFSSSTIPTNYNGGYGQYISVTVTSGMPEYTYQWSSSIGGTFGDPTAASTYYEPPNPGSPTQAILTCVVTDACGRRNFITQIINITPSPLPVTLVGFTAKANKENKVELKWTTISEVNNDYFTIQRSEDGISFKNLVQVDGAGNSTQQVNYFHTDENPFNGTSYYRLKQTDFDGRNETFSTLTVKLNKNGKTLTPVSVSPNPFTNSFSFQITSEEKETISAKLISMTGATVYSETFHAEEGTNTFRCEIPGNVKQGFYVLRVATPNSLIASEQVIKK